MLFGSGIIRHRGLEQQVTSQKCNVPTFFASLPPSGFDEAIFMGFLNILAVTIRVCPPSSKNFTKCRPFRVGSSGPFQ